MISDSDLKFQPCLGCNAKCNMCCFQILILHYVYIKLSKKQFAESDKSLHELFHRPRLSSYPGFLHLKFLCMVETTTTKSLHLPEY